MGQLVNVLLSFDKEHRVPHRALDCGPGFSGLNQVYGANRPTDSVYSICGKYSNIFTKCINRKQIEEKRGD